MGTRYRGKAAEVRALDAHIKLARASATVQGVLGRDLRRRGVTESQFGVLEALFHLGPLSQHDLGAKRLATGGNISVVVDHLEERRLVRRVRGETDRRVVTVHLTPVGRRLVERIFPGHLAAIVETFGHLTAADQETLGRLCRKLGLGVAADQVRRE